MRKIANTLRALAFVLALAAATARCNATTQGAVKTFVDPIARLFCAVYPALRATADAATDGQVNNLDASAP